MKLRQQLFPVNAERHLQSGAENRLAVGPVRNAGGRFRSASQGLRTRQDALAQACPLLFSSQGRGAGHQAREIQLKSVLVVRRVGAFYVAQFALIAGVEDAVMFGRRERAHAAVMPVDRLKQLGKRRAQIEAQPAAVANLEYSLDLAGERRLIPVERIIGVIRQPRCGCTSDDIHGNTLRCHGRRSARDSPL